jgi:hypothetical protein
MTDSMWTKARKDTEEAADREFLDQITQACACLVYLGPEGSIPVAVPARVVKLHAGMEVTFSITDPAWKARLGWGPGAHVELQVRPHPETWIVDHFCWHQVQGPPCLDV